MKTFTWQCVICIALVALTGVAKCDKGASNTVVTAIASIVFLIVVLVIIVVIVVLVIKRKKNHIPGVVLSRGGSNTIVPAGMMAVPPGSIVINNPNQLYPPSAVGWANGFGHNIVPSNAYIGQFQVHHPPPFNEMAKTPEPVKPMKIENNISAEDEITLLDSADLASIAGSDYKLETDYHLESDYKPPKTHPPPIRNTNNTIKVKKGDSLDVISVISDHTENTRNEKVLPPTR